MYLSGIYNEVKEFFPQINYDLINSCPIDICYHFDNIYVHSGEPGDPHYGSENTHSQSSAVCKGINYAKNLTEQLFFTINRLPNLCPIYIKITWMLATLSEHMHKNFEVNRTNINGNKSWNYITYSSSLCPSFHSLNFDALFHWSFVY